jgi:CDP-2,3-bis-(O-geranylgeranyl)-sn-glycerol synthase
MNTIASNLFFVFWFFAPAGLANVAPVIAAKMPFLKDFSLPLDLDLKYFGKPFLGRHKTIRGMLSGTLVGMATALLEVYLYHQFAFLRYVIPFPYASLNPFLLGGLLGFGSLAGDAVKSFFKRRVEIPSGKSWFFYDQLDYIIGGIVFSLPIIRLTILQYILLIVLWFVLHPIATVIGYLLKLKKSPI